MKRLKGCRFFYVVIRRRALFFIMIIGNAMRLAISNPVSSLIPKWKAAEKPTIDHKKGMINIPTGHFLEVINKTPKVKMVVGHGSPNVGEEG